MRTTTEQLSAILIKEAANKHQIYLYPYHRTAWIAYEQSARNLHRLLPNISVVERCMKDIPFPLTVMVIPQLSLDFLQEKAIDIYKIDGECNMMICLPESVLQC